MPAVLTAHLDADARLVVSMPHVGRQLPESLRSRLRPETTGLDDTDLGVERLYDFLGHAGVSHIAARWSRWLIDLNRPPDDRSLYPGQATTGLVPTTSFGGVPLYREGDEPGPDEIKARLAMIWTPYHRQLEALIDAARTRHGRARLLDAHSITAVCPRLFEGRLPDINIGTDSGRSCDPALVERICALLQGQHRFSWVIDGRFKGGHITRHYGRPQEGVDAVQIELAQAAFMDEDTPDAWDDARAEPMRDLLRGIVAFLNAPA